MKDSKVITFAVALMLIAGVTLAEGPRKGGPRAGGWGGGPEGARIIDRIIDNPHLSKRLELSEEQIGALRDKSYALRKDLVGLKAELELAAMEQARILTGEAVDENVLMKAVEKTGDVRVRIAKNRMKLMLLVKNTLTEEQLEKVMRWGHRQRGEAREERERLQKRRGDHPGPFGRRKRFPEGPVDPGPESEERENNPFPRAPGTGWAPEEE